MQTVGPDGLCQHGIGPGQQNQTSLVGNRSQSAALVCGIGRAKGPKDHAGTRRQAPGDGLGIGDAGRIGEEKQVWQSNTPRQPWRQARRRPRQDLNFVHRFQATPCMSDALTAIRARIEAATLASGRPSGAVTLVAVSKTQPWEHIAPVLAAGQRVFGENRVQEAMTRWTPHRQGLDLHLIGPLQTNKARDAVGFFDVIETLDRDRLAGVLADEIQRQAKAPRLYVQVNIGLEPQKAGISPGEVDAFIAQCRGPYGLTIEGVMAIPPAGEDPAPHFAALRAIAERNGLEKLSMGMSDDFEIAIAEGATSVRVGSAIFGSRA